MKRSELPTQTQLTVNEVKDSIKKLEELSITLCDTFAYDSIIDAIDNLKKEVNEMTGKRFY